MDSERAVLCEGSALLKISIISTNFSFHDEFRKTRHLCKAEECFNFLLILLTTFRILFVHFSTPILDRHRTIAADITHWSDYCDKITE